MHYDPGWYTRLVCALRSTQKDQRVLKCKHFLGAICHCLASLKLEILVVAKDWLASLAISFLRLFQYLWIVIINLRTENNNLHMNVLCIVCLLHSNRHWAMLNTICLRKQICLTTGKTVIYGSFKSHACFETSPCKLISASWVKNMEIGLHIHGPDTYIQANTHIYNIKIIFN